MTFAAEKRIMFILSKGIDMPTVIYLHGFASVGNSEKSKRLVERFGAENVIAPDLPMDPDAAIDAITDAITDRLDHANPLPLIFVGTSLGGFYAQYMADIHSAPSVLVNPAVNPAKSLEPMLGKNTNFTTGKTFTLSEEHLDKLSALQGIMKTFPYQKQIELFLAKDDAVLDYRDALASIQKPNSVTVFEDGGHRFEAHWDEAMDKIEELLTSE